MFIKLLKNFGSLIVEMVYSYQNSAMDIFS